MSSITWSYGVTTVPSRFNRELPLTLKSLSESGFDAPRLFIDGGQEEHLPDWVRKYERTCHYPNLRTMGNWITALWILYLYKPSADLYAIFQDDFECSKNLRAYLESYPYPRDGYLNCYTFPENEPERRGLEKDKVGWYPSNQKGKGAVALVFDSRVARILLGSEHMINRPTDPHRGWRAVDGGIVTGLAKKGIKEYVHCPSLVQHIGDKSSMGNARHPKASTYRGKDFDLMSLRDEMRKPLPVIASAPSKPAEELRIHLVGYNTRSGLGELNRQLVKHLNISKWLVKPHGTYATLSVDNLDTDIVSCSGCNRAKIEQFVKESDVILFAETQYYSELTALAKRYKKRIVCVPMLEWMEPGMKGWPMDVSLFMCPTNQAYKTFSHVRPCVYAPWPIDTDRFTFTQRHRVERFLFIEGHGGWKGRKGAEYVIAAKKQWPEMPLVVRTQVNPDKWKQLGVEVLKEVADAKDLYSIGDVLLLPHTVDGLSLEPLEAMACGMPVISTDGEPWNEYPALARIASDVEKRKVKRPVNWYLPKVDDLVRACQQALGIDIAQESIQVRQWAELRSWKALAGSYEAMVRTGKDA